MDKKYKKLFNGNNEYWSEYYTMEQLYFDLIVNEIDIEEFKKGKEFKVITSWIKKIKTNNSRELKTNLEYLAKHFPEEYGIKKEQEVQNIKQIIYKELLPRKEENVK